MQWCFTLGKCNNYPTRYTLVPYPNSLTEKSSDDQKIPKTQIAAINSLQIETLGALEQNKHEHSGKSGFPTTPLGISEQKERKMKRKNCDTCHLIAQFILVSSHSKVVVIAKISQNLT